MEHLPLEGAIPKHHSPACWEACTLPRPTCSAWEAFVAIAPVAGTENCCSCRTHLDTPTAILASCLL